MSSTSVSADFNNANGISLHNASLISQWDSDNPRPPNHSPNVRDWQSERSEFLRRIGVPISPPRLARAVRVSLGEPLTPLDTTPMFSGLSNGLTLETEPTPFGQPSIITSLLSLFDSVA